MSPHESVVFKPYQSTGTTGGNKNLKKDKWHECLLSPIGIGYYMKVV